MNLTQGFSSYGEHSVLVGTDGCLLVFGHNNSGQLGLGHSSFVSQPTRLQLPNFPEPVRAVGLGWSHTLVVTKDGTLYGFGSNSSGQLGSPERLSLNPHPRAITLKYERGYSEEYKVISACCGAHSVVLTKGGRVFTFGANTYSQLGRGSLENDIPREIELNQNAPSSTARGTKIACGGEHTIVLMNDGSLRVWGGNVGQLGLGHTPASRQVDTPLVLEIPVDEDDYVWDIACGHVHSMVITRRGQVYAFGSNGDGQLGIDDSTNRSVPTKIPFFRNMPVIAISCGGWHSLALTKDGQVYGWGYNDSSQILPKFAGEGRRLFDPRNIKFDSPMLSIAAGYQHTLVVNARGQVWSFGINDNGELGISEESRGGAKLPCLVSNVTVQLPLVYQLVEQFLPKFFLLSPFIKYTS